MAELSIQQPSSTLIFGATNLTQPSLVDSKIYEHSMDTILSLTLWPMMNDT